MNASHTKEALVFSPVSAEIKTAEGDRILCSDPSLLAAMLNAFNADDDQSYRFGAAWGHRVYVRLEKEVLSNLPGAKTMKDIGMPEFQKLFSDYLAALGWGRFELKKRDEFLFIDLRNSALVHSARDLRIPKDSTTGVCSFYAGFFASIFSAVSGMKLASLEVTCEYEGYDWCSFLLDNETTILKIREMIKSNYSPLEAFQRIKAKMAGDA